MSSPRSQSHFTLSFPLKSPADAQVLTQNLTPFFARHVQSGRCYRHGALLPLHNSEREDAAFPGRLRWRIRASSCSIWPARQEPVFDTIFAHVENPPPTPVSDNAEAFVEWAAEHLLHPAFVYTAYTGATARQIKALAAAADVNGASQPNVFLVILPSKSRLAFAEMQMIIRTMGMVGKVRRDLDKVGTPHFAQFVPLEDRQLGFFTVYDGSFDKYIDDFTRNIGEVFDVLFKFTKGAPPSPCRKHVQEFIDFAAAANRTPIGFYQAYPGLTVQDIKALLTDSGAEAVSGMKPKKSRCGALAPEGDVHERNRATRREEERGFFHVVRPSEGRHRPLQLDWRHPGLHSPRLSHAVRAAFPAEGRLPPAAARKLLGRLVNGDETDAPQITTAKDWHVGFEPGPGDDPAEPPRCKPDYCLNLGITWPGLLALEVKDRVPNLSFKSFNAFVAGAAARAELVGDTGMNGPENWIGGFGTGNDHVMLTLHAASPEALQDLQRPAVGALVEDHAFEEIWRGDGMALMEMQDGQPVPVAKVHFGYVDGISMTTIRGGPERYKPDHQEPCEPWLFVLLDEAENYFVPEPPELGHNGSFAVFKMIRTDVVGFENFLQSNKDANRSGAARRQDVRTMAQRRSACALPGHG